MYNKLIALSGYDICTVTPVLTYKSDKISSPHLGIAPP